MIIGVGIDITDQQRLRDSLEELGDRFLQKILTKEEIAACARYRFPVEHYAGKFAAKEAFMKALGSGLGQISFEEIQVFNRESGSPYIITHHRATTLIQQLGVTTIHLSISHDAQVAVAVVILT